MAAACSAASKSDSRENFALANGLRREDVVSITYQATAPASSSSARTTALRRNSRERGGVALNGGALEGVAFGSGELSGEGLDGVASGGGFSG